MGSNFYNIVLKSQHHEDVGNVIEDLYVKAYEVDSTLTTKHDTVQKETI